jgi:alpha-D-xyloside xylohydrolase
MGDHIMVAPLFAGEDSRAVVIPEGRWYDFHTGELVGSNTVVTVSGRQRDIPLYVRDGGIVPLIAEGFRMAPGVATPLEVRHYGGSEGSFMLYDDDGETFAYERGEFCWLPLKVARGSDGCLAGEVEAPSGRSRPNCRVDTWNLMSLK